MTDDAQEQALRLLMIADNIVWRERRDGQDACDEDQPMTLETAKLIGRMKRVHHQRRTEAS